MEDRYVLVHLRLGENEVGSGHYNRILDYVGGKDPQDLVVINDPPEYGYRATYSKKWNIPEDRFYPSWDGHLNNLNIYPGFFLDTRVGLMGYVWRNSGEGCVNNALSDLRGPAKEIFLLQDMIKGHVGEEWLRGKEKVRILNVEG